MTKGKDLPLDPSIELYIKTVLSRKANEVIALDVRELTSIADVFIICSGRSSRQVSAIADYVAQDLKKHNIRPMSIEGKKEGQWVLLDYGHVIIHVFYEPVRKVFDLEGLWIDAKRIETHRLHQPPKTNRVRI